MNTTIQLSIFTAIISATIAYVKLISDSDDKISDFRKEWNESLRKSISELNSSILAISGRIIIENHNNSCSTDTCEKLRGDLFSYWKTLREAESLIYLHFHRPIFYKNFIDKNLKSIQGCRKKINTFEKYISEQEKFKSEDLEKYEEDFTNELFCAIISTIKLIENKEYSKIVEEEKYIQRGIGAINFFSSQILKITWEKVKKGEEKTRESLEYTGVLFRVIIFVFSLFIIFFLEYQIILFFNSSI
ncbi:MAG: hypothetical protein ACYCVG_01430 [Leptospirillum sp.]